MITDEEKKAKKKEYDAKRNLPNKEINNARDKIYRKNNAEIIAARKKVWDTNNKEHWAKQQRERRAEKARIEHEKIEAEEKAEYYKFYVGNVMPWGQYRRLDTIGEILEVTDQRIKVCDFGADYLLGYNCCCDILDW